MYTLRPHRTGGGPLRTHTGYKPSCSALKLKRLHVRVRVREYVMYISQQTNDDALSSLLIFHSPVSFPDLPGQKGKALCSMPRPGHRHGFMTPPFSDPTPLICCCCCCCC